MAKKPTKKTPAKKKPASKKAPAKQGNKRKDLKNYTYKDGHYYDKEGKKVTHSGVINLLNGKTNNWKKGESGNPNGRAKGSKNRSTILKELLELDMLAADGKKMGNPLNPDEESITYEKAVMVSLIKRALKGDVRAIREIQDTVHGKIKDETDVNLHQNEPLEIIVKKTIHNAED